MSKKDGGLDPATAKLLEEAGELIIGGRLVVSQGHTEPAGPDTGTAPEKESEQDG